MDDPIDVRVIVVTADDVIQDGVAMNLTIDEMQRSIMARFYPGHLSKIDTDI